MDESPTADEALSDIRRILRGGPKPARLATLHALRTLSHLDSRVRPTDVGKEMVVWLRDRIRTTRITDIGGNWVDPVVTRLCLELLLGYQGGWRSLPYRRELVLGYLGIPFSVEQMRRPHSPERELLRKLAEHLVSTAPDNQN